MPTCKVVLAAKVIVFKSLSVKAGLAVCRAFLMAAIVAAICGIWISASGYHLDQH